MKEERRKLAFCKENILDALKSHRELMDNKCQIVETEAFGKVLQVELTKLGGCEISVFAEVAFLDIGENKDVPFLTAQLGADIFKNIPEENIVEVIKTCNYVNGRLLTGLFGVAGSSLYYKCNLMIREFYPEDVQIQMIADALLNLEQSLNIFVDSFAFIGRGLETPEDEIKSGII